MSRKDIKPLKLDLSYIQQDDGEECPGLITPNRMSKIKNLLDPDEITIEIFKQRYNTKQWPPLELFNDKTNKINK